ncbi:Nse4 C-terminal-domain-containing protein [Suillus variegatus]|nr:Nse4 C-terminal-domain-containing protein [Suillus variegatus]
MNSDDELRMRVDEICRLLDTVEAINLFRLIINPCDFGQSVENIYHLSFLVHDGTCSFQVAENGEPLVACCQPCPHEECAEGIKHNQLVMEFDMATWRRAIDIFDIRHPFIPHRASRPAGS